MIPKNQRLNRLEVDSLKRNNQLIKSDLFTILFIPSPVQKYGVLISKKIAKQAVTRNRLKRQIIDIAHQTTPTNCPPTHMLIIPRPFITTKSNQLIRQGLTKTITNLCSKISLST